MTEICSRPRNTTLFTKKHCLPCVCFMYGSSIQELIVDEWTPNPALSLKEPWKKVCFISMNFLFFLVLLWVLFHLLCANVVCLYSLQSMNNSCYSCALTCHVATRNTLLDLNDLCDFNHDWSRVEKHVLMC